MDYIPFARGELRTEASRNADQKIHLMFAQAVVQGFVRELQVDDAGFWYDKYEDYPSIFPIKPVTIDTTLSRESLINLLCQKIPTYNNRTNPIDQKAQRRYRAIIFDQDEREPAECKFVGIRVIWELEHKPNHQHHYTFINEEEDNCREVLKMIVHRGCKDVIQILFENEEDYENDFGQME